MKVGTMLETAYETYTVTAVIGEGGAGRICRVTSSGGATFAAKILKPEMVRREKLARFQNEVNFCRRTDHKNVIKVVDEGFFQIGEVKCPFFVMPLFDGTLRELMKKGIRADRILGYFAQMLDGVEAAHLKGCFHRDLKPENILHEGATDRLVVADFGIAHFEEEFLAEAVKTQAADKLANFLYAAPEQREKGGTVSHLSDVYSLGLILNEMFTAAVPHGSGYKKISAVSADYSFLDEIVEKLISQNPANRPQTIEQVKELLIAREQLFITRQKLSKLEKEVVPESTTDDPLVRIPVKVVRFDYDGGQLIAHLNHDLTPLWIRAFLEEGANTWTSMLRPDMAHLVRAALAVPAPENYATQAGNLVREWITNTNRVYAERVAKAERQEREKKARDLKAAIEAEKRRAEILKQLNP